MGNQISNEHERNKSADNVLERRGRRGSDDDHTSKSSFRANTSFMIEYINLQFLLYLIEKPLIK